MKKIAVAFTFFFLWVSNVQAQTQFFAGKTIRIVVGLPAGDVYDLYARMLAEHMGKHIPGNPNIIVQNMAGAASMINPKFTWLGSFEKSNNLLYMRSDTPFKTIHDVTKANEPPKCGSTGTGSPSYYLVRLLNDAVGTKFDIVTGYQGGQEIDL